MRSRRAVIIRRSTCTCSRRRCAAPSPTATRCWATRRSCRGAPNLFGLVQGEANAIAPGKRMLSSMAPALLLDADGEVSAVAGARGGPRIITATWQVLSNVVDFGMNALEAVHAPRLHQQWQPDEIALEQGGFTPDQIAGLERRGHRLRFVPDLASSPVILRDPKTRQWTGAADPRRGGEAAGR
jgi:gamma-glutamyltranspeptidase/glutathione hydrolase